MWDSFGLTSKFMFQILEIFSSMSCKAFMIIQSLVIMVSIKLSLSSNESILGPIFGILLQTMFNHVLLVLGLKLNIINHMVYSSNFLIHSDPGIPSPWTSLNTTWFQRVYCYSSSSRSLHQTSLIYSDA